MPYALGIDLGTARTTAAISRNDQEGWQEPQVVPLDGERAGVASVLHLTDHHAVEVGSEALRHAAMRPDRAARFFLDRIGDEVPLTLGGRHYPAELLTAALVGWVVDRAEEMEGMPATRLVVTHPVGWGAHRRAALLGALRDVNLPELTMLPRPVAAAEAHAAGDRVEVGEQLAVYSLGAGRFEAAVLRRGAFGFELCGHADSVEVLGGALFDDLLAEHVHAELGEVVGASLAGLRGACIEAKERLSTEIAVTIPAPPNTHRASVAVSRSAFEQLIRPAVESTVDLLVRTIKAADPNSADPNDAELRAVVLVGGSARIPLVAELVAAAVRARVVVVADPGTAIARGAALAAAKVAKPTVRAPALAVTPTSTVTQHTDLMRMDEEDFEDDLPELGEVADIGPPPPRPPVEIQPLEPPPRGLAKMTTRMTRRGGDLDDLDRRPRDQDRAWDFEDDDSNADSPADRPRRRRRDYAEATEDDR